jgi:putative ABC transport system permease protein
MIGFLIYWIMNIRKRKLQFGILRAMGMTRGKVTLMLLWEHLMTTGVSVLMGMAIGNITVKLFVPLLQIAYGDTTLPLELVTNSTDKMRVYFTVFVMLIAGIAILAGFINKLMINEAVKIGED